MKLKDFIVERLNESSTWQGLGFILTLTGSHLAADFDIAGATALGALVSAVIKLLFPDSVNAEKQPLPWKEDNETK